MKTLFTAVAIFALTLQSSFAQENEIPDNGNVGIGTTNPTVKLDVRGGARIDSTVTIGDSLTVENSAHVGNDLTVTGNAYFKTNAEVGLDFSVGGRTQLAYTSISGELIAPNLSTTTSFENMNLLLSDTDGNILKVAGGLGAFTTSLYGLSCHTIGGVVQSPTWANGPNKVFLACPEVNVGVGTNTPLYSMDVRGTGYFSSGIRVGGVTTSTFANTALFEGERSVSLTSPLVRLSVKKNDGTNEVRFKVENDGLVYCTGVKIRLSNAIPIPDFVFKPTYNLMSLADLKAYIIANSHLPNVPSEIDLRENGLSVDEMQLQLLQKIEELTLYFVRWNEQNTALTSEVEALKAQVTVKR